MTLFSSMALILMQRVTFLSLMDFHSVVPDDLMGDVYDGDVWKSFKELIKAILFKIHSI